MAAFTQCGDSNTDSSHEGSEQVPPPVLNSGAETEMERATESVKQDTGTSTLSTSVGKDPDEGGKAKDTSRGTDSTGLKK